VSPVGERYPAARSAPLFRLTRERSGSRVLSSKAREEPTRPRAADASPAHYRRHTTARSVYMSACVLSSVTVRAPAPGATAPRARRAVACAARADRSADEAQSVSVADRLRGAAVATAAAAALVACAPDAALANAFDGDLSPTNGPLKSLPKGARARSSPHASSRNSRSFLARAFPPGLKSRVTVGPSRFRDSKCDRFRTDEILTRSR